MKKKRKHKNNADQNTPKKAIRTNKKCICTNKKTRANSKEATHRILSRRERKIESASTHENQPKSRNERDEERRGKRRKRRGECGTGERRGERRKAM